MAKSGKQSKTTGDKSAASKKSVASTKASTSKKPAAGKQTGKKSAAPGAKKSAAEKKPAVGKKSEGAKKSGPEVKGSTIALTVTADAADAVREIVEIAQRVDESGLRILLDAARAVETKGKIEKFNRELNVSAQRAASRRRELARPEYQVQIERTKDDFFIIQLDVQRVFFNRQEMREITRLCHAAKDAADGARRMFRWFEKERSDLLADAGINSERNPYLIELYHVVVSTYTVKQ